MMDPVLSASELVQGIRSARFSQSNVLDSLKSAFDSLEPGIRAYLNVSERLAGETTTRLKIPVTKENEGIEHGETELAGLPIAIKDNICVQGWKTTAGSKILQQFTSPYDATVVEKLKTAGATILGKTNLDEFGMGSSNANSAFFATSNPWDVQRVPGGSSGGSAAAVAAGMVPWALGSDTGGSIRQPAAFCGLTGLKPTYGRVSRYGLIAFASSLEQIGPICRSAKDAALLLRTIAGHDPRDATSVRRDVPDFVAELRLPPKRLRIGLLRGQWEELPESMVIALENAIHELGKAGHELGESESRWNEQRVAAYYLIASCEASSNLARYDGVRYTQRIESPELESMYQNTRTQLLGEETRRRIVLGTFALSAGYADEYYGKASKMRRWIQQELQDQFRTYDVLLGPTTPTTAFLKSESHRPPAEIYRGDVFTVTANLAGIPAISIPCGFDANGMPIGMQLMAPHFCESRLLQLAHQFQTATDWHLRRPM